MLKNYFREYRSRPVSRILYFNLDGKSDDHSSRVTVARNLKQPTRFATSAVADKTFKTSRLNFPNKERDETYLALHRMGFTKLPMSPPALVSSYLTFSPLPPNRSEAVCFLWHFPACRQDFALRSIPLYGVRTFLPQQ